MAYQSVKWEQRFLDLYIKTGNVTLAAKGAGISRTTVYERRKAHPEFDDKVKQAHEEAIGTLEEAAWKRAKKYSDTLLIFLLKSLKPDVYRENLKVTYEHNLSPDLINEMAKAVAATGADPEKVVRQLIEASHARSAVSRNGA